MWIVGSGLLVVWFILKFVFHKGGFVHIFLLCAVAVAVVQFVHERRAARP